VKRGLNLENKPDEPTERQNAALKAVGVNYETLRTYSYLTEGEELFIDLADLTSQEKHHL
jgi:hypothetical protein